MFYNPEDHTYKLVGGFGGGFDTATIAADKGKSTDWRSVFGNIYGPRTAARGDTDKDRRIYRSDFNPLGRFDPGAHLW